MVMGTQSPLSMCVQQHVCRCSWKFVGKHPWYSKLKIPGRESALCWMVCLELQQDQQSQRKLWIVLNIFILTGLVWYSDFAKNGTQLGWTLAVLEQGPNSRDGDVMVGNFEIRETIGLIGLTRVGSRRVVQIAAGFMIFFSLLGKQCPLYSELLNPSTHFSYPSSAWIYVHSSVSTLDD